MKFLLTVFLIVVTFCYHECKTTKKPDQQHNIQHNDDKIQNKINTFPLEEMLPSNTKYVMSKIKATKQPQSLTNSKKKKNGNRQKREAPPPSFKYFKSRRRPSKRYPSRPRSRPKPYYGPPKYKPSTPLVYYPAFADESLKPITTKYEAPYESELNRETGLDINNAFDPPAYEPPQDYNKPIRNSPPSYSSPKPKINKPSKPSNIPSTNYGVPFQPLLLGQYAGLLYNKTFGDKTPATLGSNNKANVPKITSPGSTSYNFAEPPTNYEYPTSDIRHSPDPYQTQLSSYDVPIHFNLDNQKPSLSSDSFDTYAKYDLTTSKPPELPVSYDQNDFNKYNQDSRDTYNDYTSYSAINSFFDATQESKKIQNTFHPPQSIQEPSDTSPAASYDDVVVPPDEFVDDLIEESTTKRRRRRRKRPKVTTSAEPDLETEDVKDIVVSSSNQHSELITPDLDIPAEVFAFESMRNNIKYTKPTTILTNYNKPTTSSVPPTQKPPNANYQSKANENLQYYHNLKFANFLTENFKSNKNDPNDNRETNLSHFPNDKHLWSHIPKNHKIA